MGPKPGTPTDLAVRILRLPEGHEITHNEWTVCKLGPSCWKAHVTGTHPDATGEFLDDPREVREWAADHV